jgi:hypothetical protein
MANSAASVIAPIASVKGRRTLMNILGLTVFLRTRVRKLSRLQPASTVRLLRSRTLGKLGVKSRDAAFLNDRLFCLLGLLIALSS